MAIGSEVEHWDIVIVGAGIAGLATVCVKPLKAIKP
jgi:cation diffusion facilitator CzcD-associated flavoprotein CzcO